MLERTLSIIKPDAVKNKVSGKIISMFEENGFNIVSMRKTHLSELEAKEFYKIHAHQPFYMELVEFMISDPCIVLVLEKENAVFENRKLMGATNPADALEGTIRKLYGAGIDSNAVHGSDSIENSKIEINFFFKNNDL